MPFSTDDPNAQELLARNSSFDAPTRQDLNIPGMPPPVSPLPPPIQQQAQQPGGIRKFFASVLAGMSDAAMKESTGMNSAERAMAQLEIQQKQQQVQFGPMEAQAKLNSMTAQPRFDPDSGQFLGVMNDAQYTQYVKGQGASKVSAASRKEVQGLANQGKENVAKINQGMSVTIDPEIAQLAGQPQLAGQQAGKGTLSNINKALTMKGYHLQDLGNDGMWLMDRAGNKLKQVGQSPSVSRATAFATARAANTPFETVDADGNPTTISNAQALKTGAPGVGRTNLTQVKGKQALIDDIRGGIQQVRSLTSVIDRPGVKMKVAAALADPGLTTQTVLQSPVVGSMKPDEQQYVINLLNLKENAMAMRSVLGAGQGSEDLRTAITKTIPNAMTPDSRYANAQLDTFTNTLGRLEKGIPQVKAPAAKKGQTQQAPTASSGDPFAAFGGKSR